VNNNRDDSLSKYSNKDTISLTQTNLGVVNKYYDEGSKKSYATSKYATPADSAYQFKANYATEAGAGAGDSQKNYIRNYSTSNIRSNIHTNSFQTETSVLKDGSRNFSASRQYSEMGGASINSATDMKHLEKLKSKIKDLENKIGTFTKGT
jgi:hypothetical protein